MTQNEVAAIIKDSLEHNYCDYRGFPIDKVERAATRIMELHNASFRKIIDAEAAVHDALKKLNETIHK
jgi:hypothetical protein